MDGNVQGMSLAERGAYITLLCICWQEQSIPDDEIRLARMVGLPLALFKKLWPSVRVCFTPKGDAFIHKRLEIEREKQEAYRRRQSDKGKASAANRKATERQPEANHGSTGPQPDGQPNVNSPISDLRSPLKNKKELSSPKEPANPEVASFLKWFPEEYKLRRHGADYLVVFERDGSIVKRLLKTASYQRLQKLSQIMLSDKCEDDYVINSDRSIQILSTKFNWLSDRLAQFEARVKSA